MCVCFELIFYQSIRDSTPYEKWSGIKPSADYLWVFGLVVHVKTSKKVSKLEDRRSVMIFIRYELVTKVYRCLDPIRLKVTTSRDVLFLEISELGLQSTVRSMCQSHSHISH